MRENNRNKRLLGCWYSGFILGESTKDNSWGAIFWQNPNNLLKI